MFFLMGNMDEKLKYTRILLKVSGEALMGDEKYGISNEPVTMIANEIKNAQDLCFEYNNTRPSAMNKKMEILQKLNIKMGKRFTVNNSICYVQKLNLLKVLTVDMFLI